MPQDFKKLIEANWNLQFKLSAAELEVITLKSQLKFAEDTVHFTFEKFRLEDVLSKLLTNVANESDAKAEVDQRLDKLVRETANLAEHMKSLAVSTSVNAKIISSMNRLIMDENNEKNIQKDCSEMNPTNKSGHSSPIIRQ